MINYDDAEELRQKLIDRFTPEELIEAMSVNVDTIFDKFYEECLDKDWSEYFE